MKKRILVHLHCDETDLRLRSAMVRVKMDRRGRILIPAETRAVLGLRVGAEFEVACRGGVLVLKPALFEPLRVDGSQRRWGREAFLPAGEATFGS